jgi:NAD(P)-dependent dehydrogenase (short-subunit alcohol dehydrogenase family)
MNAYSPVRRLLLPGVLAGMLVAGPAPAAVAAAGPAADAPGTVLITGSSRGIGLEFARQFAARGWLVIATCREPATATALAALAAKHANLVVERLDITDGDEVAALAARYRGQPIDLLVNNAAHLGPRLEQELGGLDWAQFGESYETNAVGPLRVTRAFLDNVAASRGKRILTLSSAAGSVAALTAAPVQFYQYRASKAALNMLMRGVALDVAGRGILVGIVNPGLVDTRGIMKLKPGDPVPDEFVPVMPLVRSGALKLITPAESVTAMIGLMERLTPQQSGTFLNYDGTPMPW